MLSKNPRMSASSTHFTRLPWIPPPASAEDKSSLFDWFIGTMVRSDSSRACMSDVRLCACSDRPRFLSERGTPEVVQALTMEVLGRESLVIGLTRDHPRQKLLSLDDVRGEPLIWWPRNFNPLLFDWLLATCTS